MPTKSRNVVQVDLTVRKKVLTLTEVEVSQFVIKLVCLKVSLSINQVRAAERCENLLHLDCLFFFAKMNLLFG